MSLRAVTLLRQNVLDLLRTKGYLQKDLAFAMKRDPTTINKFLTGKREIQLSDLDRVADFFGLATYQLFQPGISSRTERRSGHDRRLGRERRISHAQRQALEPPTKVVSVPPEILALAQQLEALPHEMRVLVQTMVDINPSRRRHSAPVIQKSQKKTTA